MASQLADLQQVDMSEPLFSDASTAKAAHSCYNDNDYGNFANSNKIFKHIIIMNQFIN